VQRFAITQKLLQFSTPNPRRLWNSLMRAHVGPYDDLETQFQAVDAARSAGT
jgi:hypothetical protein